MYQFLLIQKFKLAIAIADALQDVVCAFRRHDLWMLFGGLGLSTNKQVGGENK